MATRAERRVRDRWSTASIAIHWTIALLVLGNLAIGSQLGDLLRSADPERQRLGFELVQLHKSMGLSVLALTVARIVLRLAEGFQPLPRHMTSWERALARLTHYGFYVLLLALPLSGWVMVSASPLGLPTFWFGLFEWPHLPTGPDPLIAARTRNGHELLAWLMVATILLHVAGALKHHFVDRDEVLVGMLPLVRRRGRGAER